MKACATYTAGVVTVATVMTQGNVAEVGHLRHRLMRQEYVDIFRCVHRPPVRRHASLVAGLAACTVESFDVLRQSVVVSFCAVWRFCAAMCGDVMPWIVAALLREFSSFVHQRMVYSRVWRFCTAECSRVVQRRMALVCSGVCRRCTIFCYMYIYIL